MGNQESECLPSEIANTAARKFYESILSREYNVPQSVRESSNYKRLISIIFESLRRTPDNSSDIGIMVTGRSLGPLFVNQLLLKIDFPMNFTRVSLRKSSLKGKHSVPLSDFLKCIGTIQEFDVSENDLGDNVSYIIAAALKHPSLRSLVLEDTGITDKSAPILRVLIKNNRKLDTLRVSPSKIAKKSLAVLATAIKNNYTLTSVDVAEKINIITEEISNRNMLINSIIGEITNAPFNPLYGTKVVNYKSIKGREMAIGKIKQQNQMKSKDKSQNQEYFNMIKETEERAQKLQRGEAVANLRLRCAHAEMIGRRDRMEDVTIILNDFPEPGSMLFGLFDGHGGREAAEYASKHLPGEIKRRLQSTRKVKQAYVQAFTQVHSNMKPTFVYVGTTAVVAVISGGCLTVAAVGDSRCVLSRGGKAVRLTTDHKPDLPEERRFIESRGGTVQAGRVSGMLAVSRALGDGLFSDLINPTPCVTYGKLSKDDTFLILACDGVWDVMKDQEAVDLIATEIDPLRAAKKIRDRAFERRSLDNISVLVVFLAEAIAAADV